MTIFKRIYASLFGALLIFAVAPGAKAVVIGFETGATSTFLFQEGGFDFVNTVGTNPLSLNNFSGGTDGEITPQNLFGTEGIVMDQNSGGAFDLNSFGMEVFTGQDISSIPVTVTITGTKSNLVDTVTENFSFSTDSIFTPTLDFTDLAEVVFSASGSFASLIALDDIDVTETQSQSGGGNGGEVPEPGSLALLGGGLLGMAMIRRRRKYR